MVRLSEHCRSTVGALSEHCQSMEAKYTVENCCRRADCRTRAQVCSRAYWYIAEIVPDLIIICIYTGTREYMVVARHSKDRARRRIALALFALFPRQRVLARGAFTACCSTPPEWQAEGRGTSFSSLASSAWKRKIRRRHHPRPRCRLASARCQMSRRSKW